jgi:hypothetical protein
MQKLKSESMDVNKRVGQLEESISDGLKKLDRQAVQFEKLLKRMDFANKRIVKSESRHERSEQRMQALDARIEKGEKNMDALFVRIQESRMAIAKQLADHEKRMETAEKRMEAFDKKLSLSIVTLEKKNKREARRVDKVINTQSRINDNHLKLFGELIKKINK